MSHPSFIQSGFHNRLAHVIEECGEALAAAGKTQRWGPDSVNPLIPEDQRETNIFWLRRELVDVVESIRRLDETMAEDLGYARLFEGEP